MSKLSPRWITLAVVFIIVFGLIPGITLAQPSTAPQIHLQVGTFDPLRGEPPKLSEHALSISPIQSSIHLLQFTGPVREQWKAAVEGLGVRLYGYIPDYAFIARLDAETKSQVSALPFVRWIGPYHLAYRISPGLQNTLAVQNDSRPVTLVVETLPEVDLDPLLSRARSLGANVQQRSQNDFAGYLRLDLPADRVAQLAALDGVVWIEPYFEPELFNDIGSGEIMKAGTIRSNLSLYGSGQILGVADSGLDQGAAAMSADFTGRVIEGQAICANFGRRDTWNDFHGHGTHVSGSVLGSGKLSGSDPANHQYSGSFAGVSPEAGLVFQSIDDEPGGGLECVPTDLFTHIFKPAHDLGARIHTDSWGGPTGGTSTNPEFGGYTSGARNVDQTAWTLKDLLILFAAGNSGVDADSNGLVDPDSMAAPGTAKNAITVGASENNRPDIFFTWGAGWPDDYPANPIFSDLISDDPKGMAAFSSRGPTDDGRIKPDLVAPGTFIISARSHDPSAGTGWGAVNDHYVYNGGTSMATPLTAGAAALVREWLVELRNFASPSAALVKAALINGAIDISPGQYASPQEIPATRPNNVAGWGRVDLAASLNPSAPQQIWLKDYTAGLITGKSVQFELTTVSSQTVSQLYNGSTDEFQSSGTKSDRLMPSQSQATVEPPSLHPDEIPEPSGRQLELRIDEFDVNQPSKGKGYNPSALEYAIPMTLDDGDFESVLGVGDSTYAYQFIWLNRFSPDASNFPFALEEIRVMFYDDISGSWNVRVGDGIDLLVYQDSDGNPANGADLLATFHETIQAVDGATWSVYNLSSPVVINDPGDVLIGVINRYVIDGVTPMSYPATADTGSNKGRSWIGVWNNTPPDPAELPPDYDFSTTSGNWMIRGYGQTGGTVTPTATSTSPTPSPTVPPPSGGPFRITLAWTDYPGSTTASKALVNNLDLEVIAPDGKHYYGNIGVYGAGHSCLREGKWDRCNNVEGVLIPKALYGSYTVIVHGYNVPNGPQPFALVASGDHIEGVFNTTFLPLIIR